MDTFITQLAIEIYKSEMKQEYYILKSVILYLNNKKLFQRKTILVIDP